MLPVDRHRYVSQWLKKVCVSQFPEGLKKSPIFVVPKKTFGEFMLVPDFRRTNKKNSFKNGFPVNEHLTCLTKFKYADLNISLPSIYNLDFSRYRMLQKIMKQPRSMQIAATTCLHGVSI